MTCVLDDMTRTGPRDELTDELRRMAEGWSHLVKDDLAAASADGADRLEAGDTSVRVGHTSYVVKDG